MVKTKIEFVSTQGSFFEVNMQLIKDYIMKSENIDPEFAFYFKSYSKKNSVSKKGILKGRRIFCKKLNNAICVDSSLPKQLTKKAILANRILLAVSFDSSFKIANSTILKNKKKNKFNSFNFVITGSPFQKKLFEEFFNTKAKLINDVLLPYNYELKKGDRAAALREKFEYYYPEIKNKKIITILSSKNSKNPLADVSNFDLKKFLDKLDDDYFVFTNNEGLLEKASVLTNDYIRKFGYVKTHLPIHEILYFTDILITNQSVYATAFSATEKTVFCLKQKNNGFEKFMKKEYPQLYIDNIDRFDINKILSGELSNESKRFSEMFNVNSDKNPYETICNILK